MVKDGNNAAQRLAEEIAEKDRRDKEQQEANRRALEEDS